MFFTSEDLILPTVSSFSTDVGHPFLSFHKHFFTTESTDFTGKEA